MSRHPLIAFHFPMGTQLDLFGEGEDARLTARLLTPGHISPGVFEDTAPLGNALELERKLSSWLEWHQTCRHCGHPRREHFTTWAAGLDLAGCAHDSDGDVRNLPCSCRGIDR